MHQQSWFYQRRFYIFIFLVVLMLHAGLLAIHFSKQETSRYADAAKPIKVKILQDALKNKKQIVQSEDPDSFKKPEDSAFLSDKDRSFERQSRAKKIDSFAKSAQGEGSRDSEGESKAKPQSMKKALKDLKLSDLGDYQSDSDPYKKAAEKYAKAKKGLKTGDPASQQVSATNDYVEEVPLGDLTYLNTVEYKYHGFYFRIRQKLEQFWGRSIQEKAELLMSEGRRIPAGENLITSLQITLDEKGEITSIKIETASGVKELDDAAIESFNKAGPFPNPPKDLVVNGRVTFAFGFVVTS